MNYTKTRRRPNKGREWLSEDGNYKVVRAMVYSPPQKAKKGKGKRRKKKYREGYYALVKGWRRDGKKFWDFSELHDIYPTRDMADRANELNRAWWLDFLELDKDKGSRVNKLKALVDRGPRMSRALPYWARRQVTSDLLRTHLPWLFDANYLNPLLAPDNEPTDDECDSPDPNSTSDPTKTLKNADSASTESTANSQETPASTPVPSAEATVKSATKRTATRSKGTSSPRGTRARPAAKAAKSRGKSSKKSTTKPSKSGEPSTTKPKRSGKKKAESSAPSEAD